MRQPIRMFYCRFLGREKSCFHSAFLRQLSFAMEPGLVAREISGKGSNHTEEQQCQSCLSYLSFLISLGIWVNLLAM